MYLELTKELEDALPPGCDAFEWFLNGHGQVHRDVKNRLTYEKELGDLHFFVKRHLGCGWQEVFKEWYRLRKPVVSARTEWEGAETLAQAGVPVPRVLGKGERGRYPHAVESFVVLEALKDCDTLEHFKAGWHEFTGSSWIAIKRAMIHEVAKIATSMHGQGINHRDFYLNHFLINRNVIAQWTDGAKIPLHLIDLHRVQQRAEVPKRWLIKDLGSLLFSALDVGLTSTDVARFLEIYLGKDWKRQIRQDPKRWRAIITRAVKLYTGFHGKSPRMPTLLNF